MTIGPNSFEYNLLYVLTLILIISKLLFSLYLAKRIIERKKERGKFEIKIKKDYLNFLIDTAENYFELNLLEKISVKSLIL